MKQIRIIKFELLKLNGYLIRIIRLISSPFPAEFYAQIAFISTSSSSRSRFYNLTLAGIISPFAVGIFEKRPPVAVGFGISFASNSFCLPNLTKFVYVSAVKQTSANSTAAEANLWPGNASEHSQLFGDEANISS